MATYHPPGLPNEMPGKASNTRWAAQRLWSFIEKEGIPEERVIFTVADADSDFHPVYFEALTYRVSCTVSALSLSSIPLISPNVYLSSCVVFRV